MNIDPDKVYLKVVRYATTAIVGTNSIIVVVSVFMGSMVPALACVVTTLSFLAIAHQSEIVFLKRKEMTWRNGLWEFGVVTPSILVTSYVMLNAVLRMEGTQLNLYKFTELISNPPTWFVGLLLVASVTGIFTPYIIRKLKR